MKIGRFRSFAEEALAALERGRYFYLILFSIFFVAMTALRALAKPMWYDELFTYYMSRLPNLASTWAALKDGADLCPPLLYIATRAVRHVFGDGLIATRLPAMLGFLTMLLCLYRFVAVRCGTAYGFATMLFAALSGAYGYAYEARSYGMVLGFSGLALIAWQSAADGRARRWTLPALFLSLTAALMTHCYAVLILIPFGLGELVRSWDRKRVDWPVWLALGAASTAVFSYVPLLAASRLNTLDNVVFRPTLHVVAECYGLVAGPLAWPLIAGLVIVTLAHRETESTQPAGARSPGMQACEVTLAAAFTLVPLYAYLIAKFVSHVFMVRYGLASVIGFSLLLGWFAHRSTRGRPVAGLGLTMLFAGWFLSGFAIWMANTAQTNVAAAPTPDAPVHSYELAPELVKPALPFVAAGGLFFLEADHYGSPAFVSRLIYLMDRDAALRYTGSDQFDSGFVVLRRWFPLRGKLENYKEFVHSHRRFLVFAGFNHPLEWLTKKLIDDGAELRFLGEYHGAYSENVLLEAIMPAPAEETGTAGHRYMSAHN